MVLRNLQPRFSRCLVGVPFQDLRSLFQAAFSVEDAIARGLWSDDTSSHDVKGRSLWDHLVGDLERLAPSVIIRGPCTSYLIGLLLSELTHPLLSISFNQRCSAVFVA